MSIEKNRNKNNPSVALRQLPLHKGAARSMNVFSAKNRGTVIGASVVFFDQIIPFLPR